VGLLRELLLLVLLLGLCGVLPLRVRPYESALSSVGRLVVPTDSNAGGLTFYHGTVRGWFQSTKTHPSSR